MEQTVFVILLAVCFLPLIHLYRQYITGSAVRELLENEGVIPKEDTCVKTGSSPS